MITYNHIHLMKCVTTHTFRNMITYYDPTFLAASSHHTMSTQFYILANPNKHSTGENEYTSVPMTKDAGFYKFPLRPLLT